ncbi:MULTISPECIES: tyrosine-type recombinase/integrase [unclassified Enterococcus]|uniref:tyrosine-type recombinase/integrase n=1 Tax=unclassified Enterococcus TaxID=2608891 RepID=UPI0013EC2429|nr:MULTISPECIES: tyrosine-type recombinase/integrase [unclassified Enterococcus]
MDSKTRKQIQEKLKQRVQQLPPVFKKFLEENHPNLSLGSRYEYAKDFHLFTDYLRTVFSEEVDDTLIFRLEKQDYLNFLDKIYRHTRSFQTAADQETQQLFENNYYGISRKQYSLNHFLRFLYQKGFIKEEISLLGNSLPETTKPAPRYMDAALFKHFDQLFIPEEGFATSREASFEAKNRPRNMAIVAILLYCGLKIHEVVELKRKDVDLTEQLLQLHRKENRLSKVPIPKEALPILSNYLQHTAKVATDDSFVFQSSHDQQISPRTIRQILSKITVYKQVSPELCRKTYRYYVNLYLDDADAVNYLCGNRYLNHHSFQEIRERMSDFSYIDLSEFVQVTEIPTT